MFKTLTVYLFFLAYTFPTSAFATLDIRLGGGIGAGFENNDDVIPEKDDKNREAFFFSGYNIDVLMSDYWIVLGARAEEAGGSTGTFYYLDQVANEYTKYGIKTKSRTYSGLVGIHFDLNTPQTLPNGHKVLYSAGILGVIPFDQNNSVEIESRNSAATTRITGSAEDQKQWSVYIEGNRHATGGFVGGLQIGYRFHTLKNFIDTNGNPITSYNGNPLELNLSHVDFRVFFGIRF